MIAIRKYPKLLPAYKLYMHHLNNFLKQKGYKKEYTNLQDASQHGFIWYKNLYTQHPHFDQTLIELLNTESNNLIKDMKNLNLLESFVNIFHSDTSVIIKFNFKAVGYIEEKEYLAVK